jgi:putative transposase
VVLPVLGGITTHESTRKPARRVENAHREDHLGDGAPRSWALVRGVHRRSPAHPAHPGPPGRDWCGSWCHDVGGVLRAGARRYPARSTTPPQRASSPGSPAPSPADKAPTPRTGARPSTRWRRANNTRNRVHHRTVNLRRDALHKLTTALAREYGTIVVEDLNVAGTVRGPPPRAGRIRCRVRGDQASAHL